MIHKYTTIANGWKLSRTKLPKKLKRNEIHLLLGSAPTGQTTEAGTRGGTLPDSEHRSHIQVA